MCMNCVSNTQFVLGNAALLTYAVAHPVRAVLADVGLADPPPAPVERDVRTVSFLRGLDLDPVAVLGAEAVAAADAWRPVPAEARRARRAAARASVRARVAALAAGPVRAPRAAR
jgi:hypothetical protein